MDILTYPSNVQEFESFTNYVELTANVRQNARQDSINSFAVINLALPDSEIVDANTIEYTPQSLGLVGAKLGGQYRNELSGTSAQTVGGDILSQGAKNKVSQVAVNLVNYTPGANITDPSTALGLTLGEVTNPYITALFTGVGLKTFGFVFNLYPKSPDDCKLIKQIAETFKHCSLPAKTNNKASMGYPMEFDIKFYTDGDVNKWLPTYSRAVIRNIDIKYSNFMHRNGFPTSVSISLSFQQLEIESQRDGVTDSASLLSKLNL